MKYIALTLLILYVVFGYTLAYANQFMLNLGGGNPPNENQSNTSYGGDISIWKYKRSSRQEFIVGVGYSYLSTDTHDNKIVRVWSLYPQLNLYAPELHGVLPFFFVRALGPSYLSARKFGERIQGSNFAFQAQAGIGLKFGAQKKWLVSLSYKHFSNNGLFEPNDGFNIPLLISFGLEL